MLLGQDAYVNKTKQGSLPTILCKEHVTLHKNYHIKGVM